MRVAVIGTGSIGRRHAINASRLAEVAVLDLDQSRAESVAAEAGAEVCSDLESLLFWKPDAAVIATPAASHTALAESVAGRVPRLLIEKPLALEDHGLEDLGCRLESAGTTARVVSNMRYHPGPALLQSSLGRIGTPFFARAHFGNWLPGMRPGADYRELYCAKVADGGGVIFDCIHEIDYLRWILGPVIDISCHWSKLSPLEIDGEDWAVIILEHESGARSEIHLDYIQQFKQRGCEIVGSEGTLLWRSEGKQPEACSVRIFETSSKAWSDLHVVEDEDSGNIYEEMMKDFLSEAPSDQLSTFKDGAAAVGLARQARAAGAGVS